MEATIGGAPPYRARATPASARQTYLVLATTANTRSIALRILDDRLKGEREAGDHGLHRQRCRALGHMRHLLGRIGNMDEAAAHSGILGGAQMEDRVENLVAAERTSRVGHRRGDSRRPHALDHGVHRQLRKVRVGAARYDGLRERLVTLVIGDTGVRVVEPTNSGVICVRPPA